MTQCWRLDTPSQTMVMATFGGLPECVYWAGPLPLGEDLEALAEAGRIAPTGGMLDVISPVSVSPENSGGFMGGPGMARGVNTSSAGWFDHERAEETVGGLTVLARNAGALLEYELRAEVDAASDMIVLQARIHNIDHAAQSLDWIAAPVLPGPQAGDEIIAFSGRWCGEFQVERHGWKPGGYLRESREGRTSHTDFPGVLMPVRGCTEVAGEAYGLHLGWSGGHRLLAEELPCGRRQVQFGALVWPAHEIAAGGFYETPPLYATYSAEGLNGVSHAYHTHLRTKVLNYAHPERARPVHYNCWEAVYFNHDLEVLLDLADRAAALGVERFVLDDGWFRGRNDDTSSLGDWEIDRVKWPDGLSPLIDHVNNLGMTFGIWFEPEMINEDSDLFRTHPEWAMDVTGPEGRQQRVMDITLPGVADYLFEKIDAVLGAYPIEYIKWDHNRPLPAHAPSQVTALYALLERVRAAHPMVEIESCASGGGRIDFGILARTQRVWLSDSNDAHARAKIQRGASYFFPPEITGSHVGPKVCHTSGRILPLAFRAAIAGSRAMGMEMDLRELDESDMAVLGHAVARFKARREVLHYGRLHRLESADPHVLAEMHVKGGQFVVFVAQMDASRQQLARPLRLAGLERRAMYAVRLENWADVPDVLNRGARNPLVAGEEVVLSGAALMGGGLQLPNAFPETCWILNGAKI